MTALQHARGIADAVLQASRDRRSDSTEDPATQAVLRYLYDHELWFLVETRGAGGIAKAETARRVT